MNRLFIIICEVVIFFIHALDVTGVECVAHRGFVSGCHENTIEAIRAAWDAGVDKVEVDVRILADNTIVLFHDKSISEIEVSTLSYDKLQELTVGYHVPTLAEVLAIFADDKRWLLDLKSDSPELVNQLLIILDDKPLLMSHLVFQSRYFSLLGELSNRLETPRLLYVTSLKRSRMMNRVPNPYVLAGLMKASGISGVSAKGRQFISREYVTAFKDVGLDFYVWTINDKGRIEFYKSLGVDGVITDYPNLW